MAGNPDGIKFLLQILKRLIDMVLELMGDKENLEAEVKKNKTSGMA